MDVTRLILIFFFIFFSPQNHIFGLLIRVAQRSTRFVFKKQIRKFRFIPHNSSLSGTLTDLSLNIHGSATRSVSFTIVILAIYPPEMSLLRSSTIATSFLLKSFLCKFIIFFPSLSTSTLSRRRPTLGLIKRKIGDIAYFPSPAFREGGRRETGNRNLTLEVPFC